MIDPLARPVRPLRHRKSKKPLSEEIQNAYKVLLATVIGLGLATGISYLYVNSLQPAKGYLLNELQYDYSQLQAEHRKLNQQAIEAQSFIHIQKSDALNPMEVAKKNETSYVEDSPVAQAN